MTQVHHALGTLASEFGLTRDVLRRIVAEAGVCSVGTRAGHPLYRLRDAYLAVIGQQKPENMNPHARLALAKAIMTEDLIRTRRGELLESGEVEQAMGGLFKLVARAFDTSVDNLERDVGLSAKQADKLEKHFNECREQLYREVIHHEEKGDQKTVQQNDGRTKKASARASRGSKGSKRLRQT